MGLDIKVKGIENLPENGRVQFVANHPLGGLDGLACIKILGERYPGFRILSNDILMNISNLETIFLPVNKHGLQGREIQKIINDA